MHDKTLKLLDYLRLKYPDDVEGNRYWIEGINSTTCLALNGINKITTIIIIEFGNYFHQIINENF